MSVCVICTCCVSILFVFVMCVSACVCFGPCVWRVCSDGTFRPCVMCVYLGRAFVMCVCCGCLGFTVDPCVCWIYWLLSVCVGDVHFGRACGFVCVC